MRILIAPDKFKGTFTAREAAGALADAILKLHPLWGVDTCPLADGGEGTLECLVGAGARLEGAETADALGRPLRAAYALLKQEGLPAVAVESASCLGLSLLPFSLRNPERASSYGLGVLLKEALKRPSVKAVITLGGTATVDGGVGFLQALGARFETADGWLEEPAGGESLTAVTGIDLGPARRLVSGVSLEAWCDVMSPLLGPKGAARMFAPQKGADAALVERLEAGMQSFAGVLEASCGRPLKDLPGAGAAGGLGLALAALGGDLKEGFAAVAEWVGLEDRIRRCDAVVTGEGRLDASTRQGKAPWGVLQMANRLGKPCYAVAGIVEDSEGEWSGLVGLEGKPVDSATAHLVELLERHNPPSPI